MEKFDGECGQPHHQREGSNDKVTYRQKNSEVSFKLNEASSRRHLVLIRISGVA
jgi:hypothetical protein